MTTRTASCSCGNLRLTCEGEPERVSICHCLACQRRSGSAFAAQARFQRAKVIIEGPSSEFARKGDSGAVARFQFCPTCGSTVHWTLDEVPEQIVVALGAFADPAFPPPSLSVYEARRHTWVAVPENVEHLD